jgi:hypothetical protein
VYNFLQSEETKMSYDETIHPIPRFNERELYEMPQVQSGEVDLPQIYLDGALKLQKVDSSPAINDFVQHSVEEGKLVVVKETSTVFSDSTDGHEVAWTHICDLETGADHYQMICDHVGEHGFEALEEPLLLSCSGIQQALRERAIVIQHTLGNQEAIVGAGRNYAGRRGIVRFMLEYSQKQPHNWLVNHRSDTGNINGFAALFEVSEARMRRTATLMVLEGDIEVTGPSDQVIRPLAKAA